MFSTAFDVLIKILESYRPQIPTGNSLRIYTLFQLFREVFFTHFMDGEFLKFMDNEEEEEDRFT